MVSTPRGSFLSRCGLFVSLYSGGSSDPVRGRAARDAALHSGSRVPREARRHRAGERWCQPRADRSSRDVVCSCLSTREDLRILSEAGRRGTPPCTVGRASRARLAGIVPASDGVNTARIVPLAMWFVRVSLLGRTVVSCPRQDGAGRRPASDGTSNPLWPPCIGRDAQPTGHRTGRPTHRHGSCTVGRASRARLAGIVPASDGVNPARIVPLATSFVRVSLLGRIRVSCPRQGGAGRRPASDGTSNPLGIGRDAQPTLAALHSGSRAVGRASRARLAGIVPSSDGVNAARIVPLAMWFVRVSLLGTICVSCPGAGRCGTPPCIGRDVQPTGHRTRRPTHFGPPCTVGRASCARLAGIVPASDGVNPARIVPLATWFVRVSLLGRTVVSCPGAGRRGTPPCIGRDAQPTGDRARRPTHWDRARRPTRWGSDETPNPLWPPCIVQDQRRCAIPPPALQCAAGTYCHA